MSLSFASQTLMQEINVHGELERSDFLARTSRVGFDGSSEGKLRIEVITDPVGFFALREEWDALVLASSVTIFQTFDWQWLWWKYFGEGLRLHILLFRLANKLVGIAPLYLDIHSFLGIKLYDQLKLLGGGVRDWRSQWNLSEYGPSDQLDIIAMPGLESEVGGRFLAYLQEQNWLDEADLENVLDGGVLMKAVVPQLRPCGWPFSLLHDHFCSRITVPGSLEEYLRGLRSSVRHRLNQARRAYSNEAMYSIRPIESREEMQRAIDDLIRLHQLRWNHLGYPGMFGDKRFQGFLKEVAERFLENDWLWLKTARMDSSCVAVRMGFRFKDCLNDFVAGFDQASAAAKRRPSLALLLSMIEDAIRWRIHTLNFARGYETYKIEFTSEVSYNWKLVVPNPNSHHPVRLLVYHIYRKIEFLSRKVYFEWVMFRVHYREHGFPLFLFRYVAFRAKKSSEKIANMLKVA
jgi:CelD/BcsL family acetyltransferase involved in cellulose biosynthesis